MLATLAPCPRAQGRGDPQESHQRRNERDEPFVTSYSDARIFAGLLGVVHFLVLSLCVSSFAAGWLVPDPSRRLTPASAQSVRRLMAPACSVLELRRVVGPMSSVDPSTRI